MEEKQFAISRHVCVICLVLNQSNPCMTSLGWSLNTFGPEILFNTTTKKYYPGEMCIHLNKKYAKNAFYGRKANLNIVFISLMDCPDSHDLVKN